MTTLTKDHGFQVGDRVRLIGRVRHNMVPVGTVGEVREIRNNGSKYTDGISIRFMLLPHPKLARMFGDDPNKPQPFNCLFPFGGRLLFEKVE